MTNSGDPTCREAARYGDRVPYQPWDVRREGSLWRVAGSDGAALAWFVGEGDARAFAEMAGPGSAEHGAWWRPEVGPDDAREVLGQIVRETWVQWAREQPDPKPSWLTPWEELDAGQREVDCRIGEALFEAGRQTGGSRA